MKSTLPAILAEILEVLSHQPKAVRSWSPEISVIEEVLAGSKSKIWWVRCDSPTSLLSAKCISLLQEVGALEEGMEPKKKKFGRGSVLAWAIDVDALTASIKNSTTQAARLSYLEKHSKELELQLQSAQNKLSVDSVGSQFLAAMDQHFNTKQSTKSQKFTRTKPPKGKAQGGVPTLLLSDWHWGEVVDPNQIEGMNEFNIQIARERADRVINTALDSLFTHQSGLSYDGIVLALAGDMCSGTIHDELKNTNEMNMFECVLDLSAKLTGAILEMADNFPAVYIPAVVGNHGRTDKKVTCKNAVKDNYDWLLYNFVMRQVQAKLGTNCNVTFDISDSLDLRYRVYGTRYLLTHGDRIKDSTSNSGFFPSLLEVSRRKQQRAVQSGAEPFDYLLCGHFHRLAAFGDVIVNGSLKGYDEYVYSNSLDIERPAQALWRTTPDNKVVSHTRIYADLPSVDEEDLRLPAISFGATASKSRLNILRAQPKK